MIRGKVIPQEFPTPNAMYTVFHHSSKSLLSFPNSNVLIVWSHRLVNCEDTSMSTNYRTVPVLSNTTVYISTTSHIKTSTVKL